MTLYVLYKDGELLTTTTGASYRKRTKIWVFRSKQQAELHAKNHKAEIIEYIPKNLPTAP